MSATRRFSKSSGLKALNGLAIFMAAALSAMLAIGRGWMARNFDPRTISIFLALYFYASVIALLCSAYRNKSSLYRANIYGSRRFYTDFFFVFIFPLLFIVFFFCTWEVLSLFNEQISVFLKNGRMRGVISLYCGACLATMFALQIVFLLVAISRRQLVGKGLPNDPV